MVAGKKLDVFFVRKAVDVCWEVVSPPPPSKHLRLLSGEKNQFLHPATMEENIAHVNLFYSI
jgi:hypothetical protein